MKTINEICYANELVLMELRRLMCGVIANKHGKSKGFQFALLHKNIDHAMQKIRENTQQLQR